MIKTQKLQKTGETKITFVLPAEDDRLPASVVGDFNGWDPMAHPLRKRSNGTASVAVVIPAGEQYEFRYLGANDRWFDEDPDGERVVRAPDQPNGLLRG